MNDRLLQRIFEYVHRREETDNGFLQSVKLAYEHNAKWSGSAMRMAVGVLGWFLRPKKSSVKYFFWGTKFSELILSLPPADVCVIGGPKQLFFCLKHQRSFLPCTRLWRPLLSGFDRHQKLDSRRVIEEIGRVSAMLTRFAAPNAYFIMDNDSLPIQRSIILSANNGSLGRAICIQHGVFQSKSPPHIFDGWFADVFFVIDVYQKRMLIDKGMNPEKIKVMGFHSSPYIPERRLSSPQDRRVCFLGQPWIKYGEKRAAAYMDIVRQVVESISQEGRKVFYKPHPWERGCAYLRNIENVVDASLSEAIEDYDVFISLTSTALLEASAAGRVAIQIVSDVFDADRFSDFGDVISIQHDSGEFLNLIRRSLHESSVPARQVAPTPLAERFLRTLGHASAPCR